MKTRGRLALSHVVTFVDSIMDVQINAHMTWIEC